MLLKEAPLVSIIITTRNSGLTIGECLQSLTSQHYPKEKIEIIVVDNNSTDKTVDIAKRFTDKIFFKSPERSAQRNFGIEKGQGKYVLYLDSDMRLCAEVIAQCVDKCENRNLVALYIPERITGDGFWIRVRDFERSFYHATCIDCVRFIKRDKFLAVGGFDETLTGPEDWDFDHRIRQAGEVGIINAPLYHNEGKFNLKRYLQKKSYYSNSFAQYISKLGKDDMIIKKQFGFWYRYFGVFTEQGKWKKLLRHPVLSLGMYYLRVFVGISYLLHK